HRGRLADRIGGGEADAHALRDGERVDADDLAPDLVERMEEEEPRREEPRLGPGDLRLHHRVVAQAVLEAARHLVRREIDEGVERGTGEAERAPGEARGVERAGREAIKRAALAA